MLFLQFGRTKGIEDSVMATPFGRLKSNIFGFCWVEFAKNFVKDFLGAVLGFWMTAVRICSQV